MDGNLGDTDVNGGPAPRYVAKAVKLCPISGVEGDFYVN